MANGFGTFLYYVGQVLTNPKALLYLLVGVAWGILGGAVPGISASIAMSLMLPLIYGLDPMLALPMLASVYVGACYGGSIPAILVQTPGTGSAAAAMLDGYAMQQRGEGGKALFTSLFVGVTGGIVSVLIMSVSAIPLANFALKFGPSQYFWLAMLGLSMVGTISSSSPTKGLMSGCLGLILSTIGIDRFGATPRFTFGIVQLNEGLEMIPVFVGIFALGEVFRQMLSNEIRTAKPQKFKMMLPNRKEMKSISIIAILSGIWGTLVGALPGAGANIASWSAYAQAKNLCKDTENFGKGDIRGVAAPESANNAVPAGALIPLLGLGVPGSNSTAMLMAGMTVAGISCGPLLFVNRPEVPYTLMASMGVAQIVLAAIGLIIIVPIAKLCTARKSFLTPAIVLFTLLGAFSTKNQSYICWFVLLFGFLGLAMKKLHFVPAATSLGFVLGKLVEDNMRRTMQLAQSSHETLFQIFTDGLINKVLIIAIIASIAMPIITTQRKKAQLAKKAAVTQNGDPA